MDKPAHILEMLRRKASSSPCCYKVAALALSRKGEVLGVVSNSFRFNGRGRGMHAERKLIRRYGKNISHIIIARVGGSGDFLPLHPCRICENIAGKLSITILSVC